MRGTDAMPLPGWKRAAGPVASAPNVVLTGEPVGLLEALHDGSMRAGITDDRVHVVLPDDATDADVCEDSDRADLVVIAIRRIEGAPPFRRALVLAEGVASRVLPSAVYVVISVAAVTAIAPKLERRLTAEVLHQLELGNAVTTFRQPLRSLRMRLGLGALRAAGVRVFRIRVAE